MMPRVVRAGEGAGGSEKAEDLDERTRLQYLAVLQYLQGKGLLEAYCALEAECGVSLLEGSLPVANVLESSLDMFASYREAEPSTAVGSNAPVAEKELLSLEAGVCCTGPLPESSAASPDGLPANVIAVAWAARHYGEYLALAATADKRLRLYGPAGGAALAEFSDFSSPLLGLDVREAGGASGFEVVATAMGGEVTLLLLAEEGGGTADAAAAGGAAFAPGPRTVGGASADAAAGSWSFRVLQRIRDHTKHVTVGRFSPDAAVSPSGIDKGCTSDSAAGKRHLLTISRDRSARLYTRTAPDGQYSAGGVVKLAGEATACCWLGPETFVLAARDDHNLTYWDIQDGGGLKERCKTNLNALGDSIVSFAVLALAVSPNGKVIAACTDKSRVIVLEAFASRQLRNLYGAIVEEYDTPSISFSLDGSFLYATSSLPASALEVVEGDERWADTKVVCGQVSIFEVGTGEQVLKLPCHERPVRCMARHPHSEALVTGSFDRTVRYWG